MTEGEAAPQGFNIAQWGLGDEMYIRSTRTIIDLTLRYRDGSVLDFVKSSNLGKEIRVTPTDKGHSIGYKRILG